MIPSKPDPPSTFRSFCSRWSELEYVCSKIHFWLYARQSKSQAKRFAPRLARILKQLPPSEMAILREDGTALYHELRGEIAEAIVHREREIDLMTQLHVEASDPRYDDSTRKYMLAGRDQRILKIRQQLLKSLRAQSDPEKPAKLTKVSN